MTTLVTQDAGRQHRVARMGIRTAPGSARLMIVSRGNAQFCIRLGEASEVGRIVRLTPMDGPHGAVLGSMVLHSETVSVIDAAVALGAVDQPDDAPRMFVATRTKLSVCIAFDELVGKQGSEGMGTEERPHQLIHGLVPIGGRSLPVIDVHAVSQLATGRAPVSLGDGAVTENHRERPR